MVTVRNTLERTRLEQIVETYRDDLARDRFHGFIGASLGMQAVYRIIDSAASSKATVFITGESGTGKEVCAEAIHRSSPRFDGPFVALNCGAIPGELMDSEMFGHVKGAFTGAVADREGAASRADGGTLFLDEICELAARPPDQAAAVHPDRHRAEGRRHHAAAGGHPHRLRHQPATRSGRWRPGASGKTSTTVFT